MAAARSAPLPESFAPMPLAVQDELWLNMDRPNNLMVIDSLVWLQSVPDWDRMRTVLVERLLEAFPVFRCRPEIVEGRAHWARDPQFTLSRHVKRVRLSGTVDEARVQQYLSRRRSKPFDRSHPLWSVDLIEDVSRPDGSTGAAFLLRVHHAIADGIRMTELALGLCDPLEGADNTIAARVGRSSRIGSPRALAAATVRAGQSSLSRITQGTTGAVIGQVTQSAKDPLGAPRRTTAGVFGLLSTAASAATGLVVEPRRTIDVATWLASFAPGGEQAVNTVTEAAGILASRPGPSTVWTGTPDVQKSAVWSPPVPLQTVKQIGRASDSTVNDVLLGAVSGMLTSYLAEHGESIESVNWMLPVSLQPFGKGMPKKLGNHFALVQFTMPLGIDDPAERMRRIHERTDRIKNSQETLLTFTVQRAIAQSPEKLSIGLTNYFANLSLGVLTNVPGPREPVALAGVQVDAILGWAPSSGDQPLTVCIYSYAGQVYVSLGADRTLIPDADRMVDLLTDELATMHRAVVEPDNPND